MRDEVIEILLMIRPQLDVDAEDLNIVEELDSRDIDTLISELETLYDVEITMDERTKENFENVDSLVNMLEKLQ